MPFEERPDDLWFTHTRILGGHYAPEYPDSLIEHAGQRGLSPDNWERVTPWKVLSTHLEPGEPWMNEVLVSCWRRKPSDLEALAETGEMTDAELIQRLFLENRRLREKLERK